MVAVRRGSTAQVTVIKEVTAGTTPSTPTMLEMPLNSFTPRHTNNAILSNQIRGHPFRDKMAKGRQIHEFGIEFELQGAVHDVLLETMFGGVITSKALAFADALKSLTIEEKVATGAFNQFTYGCFSSMSITAAAGETTPIKISLNGMARAATLDAASTLATAVTAAADVDPFTFVGGAVTIAATSTPVGSATLNFERQVDPLMLLGSSLPREYVPGEVQVTGTTTVPYDDTGAGSGATQSTLFTNFTDAAQVYKFSDDPTTPTVYRQFTFPKTRYMGLGRSLSDRGMRMQEINWEARYDSTSTTVCTMATQ